MFSCTVRRHPVRIVHKEAAAAPYPEAATDNESRGGKWRMGGNMKLISNFWILWVLIWFVIPAIATAEVPQIINYQGRLTDSEGNPVTNGDYTIRFRIWDQPTSGSVKWTSQPEIITVIDGLFDYQLGSVETIPKSVFNDDSLWLGITVGTGPELPEIEPRTRLVSSPYAVKSGNADFADTAAHVISGPGIARATNTLTVQVTNTGVTNVTSATITAPGPGYIVARAYTTGAIFGSSIGNIVVGIETSPTIAPTHGDFIGFGSQNESLSSSNARTGPIAVEKTFSVESAGDYTYYVNANRAYTGGTAYLDCTKILLTYFPVSYGEVTINPK